MLQLLPFYSPNLCAFAISLGVHKCSDESCEAVHGWSFTLQFAMWGLELEYLVP